MSAEPSLLLVTDKFAPHAGGTAVIYTQWAERLPADRLRVLTTEFPGWREYDADRLYSIQRVPFTDIPKLRWPLVWWRLYRAAFRQAPRLENPVVHCGHVLETGFIGYQLKRKYGIPFVVHTYAEELAGYGRKPLARRWMRRILAAADGITAIAGYARDLLAELDVDPARVIIQPPAADTERYRPDLDGSRLRAELGLGDRPTLITVARLLRRKGVDVTLEALARLRVEFPDLAYVVVGDGPELPRLREIARSLQVEDAVRFVGRVPHEATPEHYAAADIFIHPNRQTGEGDVEGFGIVFLEAGACGLPVVGGNSGGTPDAIRHGVTGYLVDGTSPAAVARAIEPLLRDVDLRRRMGQAGREWSRQFTWERAAERIWRMSEMIVRGEPVTAESLAGQLAK